MNSGLARGDIRSAHADMPLAIRDRYLGPAILTPVAEGLAQRLARGSTGPLLELMADTGALTQAIAAAVSADVSIIATDPNQSAVDLGSQKPGMSRVTWQRTPAEALAFSDGAFGTVACLLGIAQRPDRVAVFREARRVLRPDGRFLFAVPAHIRHNPVSACIHAALRDCFPSDPPRFLTQVLHGYADSEVIDDELTAAGFTDAVYTAAELPLVAASARDLCLGFCLGTGLRLEIQERARDDAAPVTDAVAAALRRRFGGAAIRAAMRVVIVSAAGV